MPLTPAPVVKEVSSKMPAGGGGGAPYSRGPVLIAASTCLCPFHHWRTTDDNDGPPPINIGGGNDRLPIGPGAGPGTGDNVRLEKEKPITSQLDEGMLTHKVIPVYPAIASRIGLQGDVKLHAIIARDGTVQSLNLISGHPLLAPAAMDAVRQWKYRPYVLNGQAVEVETYITVTFRKTN
jgi:TonB family protein